MGTTPIESVTRLCETLDEEGIKYCHWKSNINIALSESGSNDLDLLVERGDLQRFRKILFQLGFKECFADPSKQIPAVQDFIGYDLASDRFIHVHAHYQLVLGHDLSKNYRLMIEKPFLDSAVKAGLFMVPSPEFELVVFLFRMVIKHSTWFALIFGESKLSKSEIAELNFLVENANLARVDKLLEQHLPFINRELFHECLRSLQPGVPSLKRIRIGRQLLSTLNFTIRRPPSVDFIMKCTRRMSIYVRRRILKHNFGFRLANGGAMIAVIGGDGAGKTTAVNGLHQWLGREFDVKKIHLGKPPWSLTTFIVRGILKIGRTLGLYPFVRAPVRYDANEATILFPGYPWLIREILTARDRYLTYKRARRYVNNGRLVLSDRFPLPGIRLMDGPMGKHYINNQTSTWLLRKLIEIENRYYIRVQLPEIMIVLKTDPEIAVQRKTDEDPTSVRSRSKEIWEFNWSTTPAIVIDANQPVNDVISNIKRAIWLIL